MGHSDWLITVSIIYEFEKKQLKKREDVSSMQLICMTKQRKQILPPKTERYETKINK